jgi:hypothetical protein
MASLVIFADGLAIGGVGAILVFDFDFEIVDNLGNTQLRY